MELCSIAPNRANVLDLLGFRCNFGIYKSNHIQIRGWFLAIEYAIGNFYIMQDNVFYKMLQVDRMDGPAMEKNTCRFNQKA